jgi:hypothetical protein
VFAALFRRVAEDHLVLNFKPGVALTVTDPLTGAIVTCPVFVCRISIVVPIG